MKHIVGISLLLTGVLASCTPAMSAGETGKEECLRSVERYMTPEEAESFCNQPADCRKWWDDLSEEEQQELQPPVWSKDMDWWMKCEHDQQRNRERMREHP